MKTAIIYVSSHHGNTKKVLDVMAYSNDIDLLKISEAKKTDFSVYDAIGFASGITVYTCGINYINYARGIQKTIRSQDCEFIGGFSCRGYDTYGFFEKIGGIAKNHPNEKDFRKAREFIKNNLR